jgi:hypothetical protein
MRDLDLRLRRHACWCVGLGSALFADVSLTMIKNPLQWESSSATERLCD